MRTPGLSLVVAALAAVVSPCRAQDPDPLVVCATTPNLGALVREIAAGTDVDVHVFAKPTQDPHFVRALPSFVKELSQAELLVVVGLDLEAGWAPALIERARNPAVRRGQPGYLDASTAVRPLGVPDAGTDRSAGDVHPRGNPHFLMDPVSGVAVADAIAIRLGELRPGERERYAANAADLRRRVGGVVFGPELAEVYDFTKLLQLHRADRLRAFLEGQGDLAKLGGAMRILVDARGARVLADHDAWRYLADSFGFETVGFLEPGPGIPPSTSHLRALIERTATTPVRAILRVPYFDARAVDFVAKETGTPAIVLAHQVGALPDTDDYIAMVEENLARLARAIGGESSGG